MHQVSEGSRGVNITKFDFGKRNEQRSQSDNIRLGQVRYGLGQTNKGLLAAVWERVVRKKKKTVENQEKEKVRDN